MLSNCQFITTYSKPSRPHIKASNQAGYLCPSVGHELIATDPKKPTELTSFCTHHRGVVKAKMAINPAKFEKGGD